MLQNILVARSLPDTSFQISKYMLVVDFNVTASLNPCNDTSLQILRNLLDDQLFQKYVQQMKLKPSELYTEIKIGALKWKTLKDNYT